MELIKLNCYRSLWVLWRLVHFHLLRVDLTLLTAKCHSEPHTHVESSSLVKKNWWDYKAIWLSCVHLWLIYWLWSQFPRIAPQLLWKLVVPLVVSDESVTRGLFWKHLHMKPMWCICLKTSLTILLSCSLTVNVFKHTAYHSFTHLLI